MPYLFNFHLFMYNLHIHCHLPVPQNTLKYYNLDTILPHFFLFLPHQFWLTTTCVAWKPVVWVSQSSGLQTCQTISTAGPAHAPLSVVTSAGFRIFTAVGWIAVSCRYQRSRLDSVFTISQLTHYVTTTLSQLSPVVTMLWQHYSYVGFLSSRNL